MHGGQSALRCVFFFGEPTERSVRDVRLNGLYRSRYPRLKISLIVAERVSGLDHVTSRSDYPLVENHGLSCSGYPPATNARTFAERTPVARTFSILMEQIVPLSETNRTNHGISPRCTVAIIRQIWYGYPRNCIDIRG